MRFLLASWCGQTGRYGFRETRKESDVVPLPLLKVKETSGQTCSEDTHCVAVHVRTVTAEKQFNDTGEKRKKKLLV